MAWKEITDGIEQKITSATIRKSFFAICITVPPLLAAAADSPPPPKFVGAQSCSSSSCHGGAAVKQNEYTLWFKQDFHRERPVARLETRRAEVITEALGLSHPMQVQSCTVCHAPLQTVPAAQVGPDVKVLEGISCENCHGPAENWLRPHTRQDWTTADRVRAGMRDLKNLYVRANTCVACHQNVNHELRKAGHPELIFELDGQCAAEPRHWQKSLDKPGPQIWLVGQAVALREISWQLSLETEADPSLRAQWEGLLWLMQTTSRLTPHLPAWPGAKSGNLPGVQQWSDDLARAGANLTWSGSMTRQCLETLAGTGGEFTAHEPAIPIQARRAERLVLALDRLLQDAGNAAANPEASQKLDRLFADVQSLPDFDPARFARHLNEFHTSLGHVSY